MSTFIPPRAFLAPVIATLQQTNTLMGTRRYKNLEALKAHGSSTHFREMGKRFKDEDLLEGPIKPLFIEERGGFASKL